MGHQESRRQAGSWLLKLLSGGDKNCQEVSQFGNCWPELEDARQIL